MGWFLIERPLCFLMGDDDAADGQGPDERLEKVGIEYVFREHNTPLRDLARDDHLRSDGGRKTGRFFPLSLCDPGLRYRKTPVAMLGAVISPSPASIHKSPPAQRYLKYRFI